MAAWTVDITDACADAEAVAGDGDGEWVVVPLTSKRMCVGRACESIEFVGAFGTGGLVLVLLNFFFSERLLCVLLCSSGSAAAWTVDITAASGWFGRGSQRR